MFSGYEHPFDVSSLMVEHHTNEVTQIALSRWHNHRSFAGSKASTVGIIDATIAARRSLLTIIAGLGGTL